jgi:uncharacterized protein YeaO (DUF488 family)
MTTRPAKRAKPKPPAKSKPGGRASLRIKRVYDDLGPGDGLRILIDRLWPRGLSKALLKLDAWPRELAPTTELRRWYDHDPARYGEFRRRYRAELAEHRDDLATLRTLLKGRVATLLTATRELDLSHGRVLRELLEKPRSQ